MKTVCFFQDNDKHTQSVLVPIHKISSCNKLGYGIHGILTKRTWLRWWWYLLPTCVNELEHWHVSIIRPIRNDNLTDGNHHIVIKNERKQKERRKEGRRKRTIKNMGNKIPIRSCIGIDKENFKQRSTPYRPCHSLISIHSVALYAPTKKHEIEPLPTPPPPSDSSVTSSSIALPLANLEQQHSLTLSCFASLIGPKNMERK